MLHFPKKVSSRYSAPGNRITQPHPLFFPFTPHISSKMDFCHTTQPPELNGINRPYSGYCSARFASAPDSTPPKCLQLFPHASRTHPHTWIPRKAAPLWLQYLSHILRQPVKQSSKSRASPCAVLRIHPSSHLSTTVEPIFYASGTKRKVSSYRVAKKSHHPDSRR